MKIITRTVWILSMVSMLADMASEMLYPVVPVYLQQIGFSVVYIGLLEGIAEVTVGMSKGYFGKQSDLRLQRLPFIKTGYFLSALSKPMMAMFIYPLWIFFARFTDRLGKGIRTAPRDALLSAEATPQTRGRIFGFHRSWDTVGAVIGPIFALAYLHFFPGDYTRMFYLAFIPGLLSVACIFLLKEKRPSFRAQTNTEGAQIKDARTENAQTTDAQIQSEKFIGAQVEGEKTEGAQIKDPQRIQGAKKKEGFFSYFSYWPKAGKPYRYTVTGLLLFAVANSSDVFLLLKAKEISGSDTITISAYIFYNLVYALTSYPLGKLADRAGLKKVLVGGIVLFAMVYLGFAFNTSIWGLYALFLLYGIYAASTESVSKALISNLSTREQMATSLGLFNSLQSLALFIASMMAGLLWAWKGDQVLFVVSAVLAIISAVFLGRKRMVSAH